MTWVLDLARQKSAGDESPALFGVIVYTDVHANVKKLLRDDDYWKALDELSGSKWAVFSVRALRGEWGMPSFPPGTIGMMTMVWKEPAANRELLSAFALDDTKDLPSLVVFALEGEELHRASVRIDDSSPEAAYRSTREIFVEVASALDKVPVEQLGSPAAVFASVKSALRTHRNWRRIGDGYRVVKELRDWLPF